MISDESVQTEGIKALTTVCQDNIINREDAVFLTHNVLSILFKKSAVLDNAKVGALMLLEAFTKEGFFGVDIVENFMQENFKMCLEDKMFKIKRPFLQCLITICKHLSKEQVSKEIFQVYQ